MSGIVPSVETVIREHRDVIWRYLRHMGVRTEDVPDVFQDVLVVVARRLHEFEGRAALSTWIYRICWYQVRNHLRRRDAAREVGEPWEGAEDANLEERVLQAERLERFLAVLGIEERAIFVLYELYGFTFREIGEQMGLTMGEVTSRHRSARRRALEAARRLERQERRDERERTDATP